MLVSQQMTKNEQDENLLQLCRSLLLMLGRIGWLECSAVHRKRDWWVYRDEMKDGVAGAARITTVNTTGCSSSDSEVDTLTWVVHWTPVAAADVQAVISIIVSWLISQWRPSRRLTSWREGRMEGGWRATSSSMASSCQLSAVVSRGDDESGIWHGLHSWCFTML